MLRLQNKLNLMSFIAIIYMVKKKKGKSRGEWNMG
jgi:hypothetical protein